MSRPGLIIDLDDTIADTSALSTLRQNRRWKECVGRMSDTISFRGVKQAIDAIRESGIPVGIVTASVSFYAEKVLRHHLIEYDRLIAYHDCAPRKPHPAPIIKCLELMGCSTVGSLGVGDSSADAEAYKAAGITSFGAGWSSFLVQDAPWDRIAREPAELLQFFGLPQ
jgi:HAD superfamily hydrolase (TIGR01549 family)